METQVEKRKHKHLKPSQRAELRRSFKDGEQLGSLAARFGCSRSTAYKICKRARQPRMAPAVTFTASTKQSPLLERVAQRAAELVMERLIG